MMKKPFFKLGLILGLTFLTVGIFVNGCSKSTTKSTEGDVLRIANGTEIETMDPHLATGVPEHRVFLACFEGLMRYNPKTAEAVPGVAKSYEVSKDGLTYTFHLRADAKWSNGEPVTVHDFVFAFRRIVDPKTASQFVHLLHPVKNAKALNEGKMTGLTKLGVVAKDDQTLVVTLEQATPFFVELLPHYVYAPVPRKVIETEGDRWTKPGKILCNGPFAVESVSLQDRRVFKKNPHYWDSKNVHLSKVVFYATDNLNTMTRKFQNREVEWSTTLPTTEIDAFLGKPEYRVSPYLGVYYYVINTRKKPMDDVRVRKALAMSINRKVLTERVSKAGQVPAYAFVPPGIASYGKFKSPLKENLKEAKQLLRDAGFGLGKKFPDINLLYNTQEDHKRLALAIGQMWNRELGVTVKPFNKEWKIYLQDRRLGNFEVARAGWIGDYNDPTTFLELWTKDNPFNETGWSNPRYDELLAKAHKELNRNKRSKLLLEAENILMQELPVIPIYFYVSQNLVTTRISGWYENLLDTHPYYGISLR